MEEYKIKLSELREKAASHIGETKRAPHLLGEILSSHASDALLMHRLDCSEAALSRLKLCGRPHENHWDTDIHIIASSAGVDYEALQSLLLDAYMEELQRDYESGKLAIEEPDWKLSFELEKAKGSKSDFLAMLGEVEEGGKENG